MFIADLSIETTRRCDLTCTHCLRGHRQQKDIPGKHIMSMFNKIDYIGMLTLTGGEPSLVCDKLAYILQCARVCGIEIQNFYIATNAATRNKRFISICLDYWLYCSDNEISRVDISNDEYHFHNEDQVKLLNALSFAGSKYSKNFKLTDEYLIKQGNSRYNEKARTLTPDTYDIFEKEISDGMIYLNAKGNVIAGCDWSFAAQDKQDIIISHVDDFSIEAVKQFNERNKT